MVATRDDARDASALRRYAQMARALRAMLIARCARRAHYMRLRYMQRR